MNFPLSVVLSATTGRLLCSIDQVYKILNQVTGDNLFTHVLPRAFKFASPLIKQQYPELAKADHALLDLDHLLGSMQHNTACVTWLERLRRDGLAESYDIASHADAWISMDPVLEAEQMMGKDRVVVIHPSEIYENTDKKR